MEAIPKIRCPGCDNEIQATASICLTCMRCPSCGKRRIASDPPCVCGHPDDSQELERLVRRFGIDEDNVYRPQFSLRTLLIVVTVCVALAAIYGSFLQKSREVERQHKKALEKHKEALKHFK